MRIIPRGLRTWLYRLALERGYLDTLLTDYIVVPFVKLFRWLDRLERRVTDAIAGRKTETARPTVPPAALQTPLAASQAASAKPQAASGKVDPNESH